MVRDSLALDLWACVVMRVKWIDLVGLRFRERTGVSEWMHILGWCVLIVGV